MPLPGAHKPPEPRQTRDPGPKPQTCTRAVPHQAAVSCPHLASAAWVSGWASDRSPWPGLKHHTPESQPQCSWATVPGSWQVDRRLVTQHSVPRSPCAGCRQAMAQAGSGQEAEAPLGSAGFPGARHPRGTAVGHTESTRGRQRSARPSARRAGAVRCGQGRRGQGRPLLGTA